MTQAGYVAAGWGLTIGPVAAYVAWTLARGRRLARRLPPEERRWTDS